jgi:hypothetical protein
MVAEYKIDSEKKLRGVFPKDVSPPALLLDFAAWLKGRPWGSVGCFGLVACDPNIQFPPEADVSDFFAMVFYMPDGGQAGFWLKDTRDPEQAPIVLLSHGEIDILAPTFAHFLDRLSEQSFDLYKGESGFTVAEDVSTATEDLAMWLKTHPDVQRALGSTVTPPKVSPNEWLAAYLKQLDTKRRADQHLKDIVKVLQKHGYVPSKPGPELDRHSFRIFAAGGHKVIMRGAAISLGPGEDYRKYLKPVAAKLAKDLTAPLFAAREALAKKKKGEGLWPSASMVLTNDGELYIDPTYHHAFVIGYDEFPPALFAEDQRRYPRDAKKLQPWHKALIENGLE